MVSVHSDPHAAHEKSLTVESPTSSENIGFFFTEVPITVSQVNDVVRGSGGPSVTWNVRHAPTRDAGAPNSLFAANRATTSTTGAEATSGFDDPTIPAGSWVWFITSAVAGTVNELTVTLRFRRG
jgi:hypothetical protein